MAVIDTIQNELHEQHELPSILEDHRFSFLLLGRTLNQTSGRMDHDL